MQIAFLLYHYFEAAEVYNTIRVMITCYIWMTGFGNFVFFTKSGDFGPVRLLHMLWRLNAAAALLCWTLGNPYILYYICPLHTFYFLFSYAVMALKPSWNKVPRLLRGKLMAAGILVFLVWDAPFGIFGRLFGWLSAAPAVGAASGVIYEWYFRSGLDHWSALFGMVAAHMLPKAGAWLESVEKQPLVRAWLAKVAIAAVLLEVVMWWGRMLLGLPKLEYNSWHPYTGMVPMAVYLFFRNISSTMRLHHLALFQEVGRTTLESYLLQHHIWLTSNSKTRLRLVPGYPLLNFAVCSAILFFAANMLFRTTSALRAAVLPDDLGSCMRSCVALTLSSLLAFAQARWLLVLGAGPLGVAVTVLMVGSLVSSALLYPWGRDCRGGCGFLLEHRACAAVPAITLVSGASLITWRSTHPPALLLVQRSRPDALPAGRVASGCDAVTASLPRGGVHDFMSKRSCCEWASRGEWLPMDDRTFEGTARDELRWTWRAAPAQCRLGIADIREELCGRKVTLAGDSVMRHIYFALAELLGENPAWSANASSLRHSDQSVTLACGGQLLFLWRPFMQDLVRASQSKDEMEGLFVLGGAHWDALHVRNVSLYREGLWRLREALDSRGGLGAIWITATAVHDEALQTPDKRAFMTEAALVSYRAEAAAVLHPPVVAAVVDGYAITAPVRQRAADGVHYTLEVYLVLARALSHTLAAAAGRVLPAVPEVGRPADGLGHVWRGAAVLLIVASALALGDIRLPMPSGHTRNGAGRHPRAFALPYLSTSAALGKAADV